MRIGAAMGRACSAAIPGDVRHRAADSEHGRRNDYRTDLPQSMLEKSRGRFGDYRRKPEAEFVGRGRA